MNQKNLLALAIIATLSTGCSKSDSGSTGNDRPAGTIEGKAVDAKLINSTIRAYRWDKGIAEPTPVTGGETQTDDNGDYTLSPIAADGYFLLKATSGYYIEEATGTQVELTESQALTALVRYESGKSINLHITGMTHLATCQAEYRAKKTGNNNSDAIGLSNDLFSAMVGVAVREVEPLDITDPNNASPFMTAGLQYGMFTAAVSSLTKELAEQSGQAPHTLTSTTSIHFYQIACNDIRADGKLDGQGYTNGTTQINQLAFGTVPLTPYLYRTGTAQHMLKMAASDKNKTGLTVDAYLNRANALSMMDSEVFNNEEPTAVDMTGPTVSINVAENTYVKGTVNFSFVVDDIIGVKNVSFYVDDNFIAMGSANNTTLALNTSGYTDAAHIIKVVATDTLNNATTFTRSFNFDNSGPVVNMTSTNLVNSTSYLATGTYEENGATVTGVTVKGQAATLNTTNHTWSANITLVSGGNTFNITATDAVANNSTVETIVNVDLIKPTISPLSTGVLVTTYEGLYNLCTAGQLGSTIPSNPICVSTDNVSLNGAAIDPNLQNNGYVIFGFTPDDSQGAGVYTARDNLIVEFMYEKNGVLTKDWTPVPVQANGSKSSYYLPMVTEYLGDTWYNTTTDNNHKITIRVTDKAGNSTTYYFTLQFDVLIPQLAMTSNVSNSAIITGTPFTSRTSVDGQLLNVEYTLQNQSNTAYYVALNDLHRHSAGLTYERGIRENRARVMVEEKWAATNCGTNWSAGCTGTSSSNVTSVQLIQRTPTSSNKTIYPSSTQYSTYQNVYSDVIATSAITGVPTLAQLVGWSYSTNEMTQGFTNQYSPCANANNSSSFVICKYYSDTDGYAQSVVTTLTSTIVNTVQYENGYPRNVFDTFSVAYTMNTELINVYNDTLGQQILPTSGWYRVPPMTNIKITKAVRAPVILHYTDTELANHGSFSNYSYKYLDSSIAWNLDTNLEITRAIDPGSVAELPNVTQYTETVGQGVLSYTISR